MIIVCQKCDARLQVDEAKVPARPFSVRCPKCNSSIESSPPAAAGESKVVNDTEGTPLDTTHFEQTDPAPLFQIEQKAEATGADSALERLRALLSGLAHQSSATAGKVSPVRPAWDPRKALICIQDENRESVARGLAQNGYQVFVATDTRQAVDRMRENLLDLVLLDPRFDAVEQGAVFVTREINILRPSQRRRLFFVLLSPQLRTMDNHTAFLNNVNTIININEIDELPTVIEQRLRAYNELYKEFNLVLGVPAL
jgi:predicted Zn finger-like uncharacterized protein